MRQTDPLLSVIVPVYNEANNLEWHHEQVVAYLHKKHTNYELVYVNDGSHDNSMAVIRDLAAKDKKVRYISFSRNFGKEAATTAGLRACRGDIAVMIDADGQHPIELTEQFIAKWHEGFDVVIGVRTANINEGFVKRYGSKIFYAILNSFTGGNTVQGSTDFRLLDRRVIDEFNTLSEHNRITRGLIDWIGFDRAYVPFKAAARHGGNASYSVRKLIKLALHAFVSQTTKPLEFIGIIGALVMVLSAVGAILLLIEKYALNDPLHLVVSGSAILALFISFLVGIVLISNWLLALYIESIHNETQDRPLYIVKEDNLAS